MYSTSTSKNSLQLLYLKYIQPPPPPPQLYVNQPTVTVSNVARYEEANKSIMCQVQHS
jgi:hypothetical protein